MMFFICHKSSGPRHETHVHEGHEDFVSTYNVFVALAMESRGGCAGAEVYVAV